MMEKDAIMIKILETPEEIQGVEELQRVVWPGSETDVVPMHVMRAAAHNGGLVIGAYDGERLVGFVFGFLGLEEATNGPRLAHYSHMLGVHPDYRSHGLGFRLKRAQWQMVRHQGIDHITWTYDPLLSRNAWLNITRLGAVCNTYLREFYGSMRDGLNAGLPSDRFQVDWWVNSKRVNRRLSKHSRRPLDLAHFLAAGTRLIDPLQGEFILERVEGDEETMLLVEIPADFLSLKAVEPELALKWRMQTRAIFEVLFGRGYLVTDLVHLAGEQARSYYVLSHGEATL
jgi:predicted GNAT superfamily acetyltransferase